MIVHNNREYSNTVRLKNNRYMYYSNYLNEQTLKTLKQKVCTYLVRQVRNKRNHEYSKGTYVSIYKWSP